MRLKTLSFALMTSLLISGCSQVGKGVALDQQDTSQTASVEISKESEQIDNSAKEKAELWDEPYVYIDAAGREVALEKTPVKVVTTYLPLWESLIMLDIKPIAVSGAENYLPTWDSFEGLDLGEVVDLGSKEVNLELLTELEPDIILNQVHDLSSYDVENLEKVAPVAIFGPETKMDWRLSLREVGKLMTKEEKAEEVIKEVDKTLAEARVKLQKEYDGLTVMQMSLMDIDRFYITYRPDLYDKEAGLGLNLPEGYTSSTNYEQISMEALVEMNPDYIFVNVFDGNEAMFEKFQENSVWKSLKAVKEGHIYRLDGSGHAASGLSTVYTVNKIIETLLAE